MLPPPVPCNTASKLCHLLPEVDELGDQIGSSVVLTVPYNSPCKVAIWSVAIRPISSDPQARNNRTTRIMGTCDDESVYLGFDFSTQQVNVRSAVWCSKDNLLNMWQTVSELNLHEALRNWLVGSCFRCLRRWYYVQRAAKQLTTWRDKLQWTVVITNTATLYWLN
jgi:hypothetical protein